MLELQLQLPGVQKEIALSTTPAPSGGAKSDFIAAEEIKALLQGRDKNEQERILRWVAESLELPLVHSRAKAAGPEVALQPAAAVPHEPAGPATPSRAKDLRTFTQEKQPKSDMQFVVVAAYFLRFVAPESERKEAMTTDDLQNAARLAPWRVFKRPSVTLNNAVQQGYLDSAGRGAYRLNAVGENLVSMTLPAGKPTGNGSRPKKSREQGAGKPQRGRKSSRG